MCTLGTLLSWEADDPGDNTILGRIKLLILAHLPEGWRNWKVRMFTKEDLLGSELDPQVLNKIRFALPTVGLARAFTPDCSSLPEKTFRDMKLKLLHWPLCVGLIINPVSLASRIRGSAVQNELVVAALSDLKPLLVSREVANRELIKETCESGDDVSIPSTINSSGKQKKENRLNKLERNQMELKQMLESFMKRFEPQEEDDQGSSSDYDCDSPAPLLAIEEEKLPASASPQWVPPASPTEEDFDLSPSTKQQEPQIPAPKPHIATQGTQCQRLGDSTFNQIRYSEVQKKLHASPVFNALKINPVLTNYVSPTPNQDHLVRTDYTLGTMTHGLLLQREALANALKDLAVKHPSIKQDLKDALSGNSAFKTLSDDLLQYACGRRAEIIEQRRSALLPRDDYQATLLNAIPPSTTHLFCEEQVMELLKQPSQQTFFRTSNRKPLQTKQAAPTATSNQARMSYPGKVTKTKSFNRTRKSYNNSKTNENRRPTGNKMQSSSKNRPSTSKGHVSKKHRS